MDAQGPAAARPFAEPVTDSFPVLVDATNVLGATFGFKAIPNGVLTSPEGRIDAMKAGKFDIRRPETRELVESWLRGGEIPLLRPPEDVEWSHEALELFRRAVAAVERGARDEAVHLLERAFLLEPDNFIIRKQLWAIEEPERFYAGDIDYDWQRLRLEEGR